MKNEIHYKQNKTSIVLFLSLALATVMFINAGIIAVNAGNNNFSTTPANGNNIIEPVPTPTPRANKRGTTSKRTQTPNSKITKPTKPSSEKTTNISSERTTESSEGYHWGMPGAGTKSNGNPSGERADACPQKCDATLKKALRTCSRLPEDKKTICEQNANYAAAECRNNCLWN